MSTTLNECFPCLFKRITSAWLQLHQLGSSSSSLWDILKFVDSSRHVDQEKKERMKEEFGVWFIYF